MIQTDDIMNLKNLIIKEEMRCRDVYISKHYKIDENGYTHLIARDSKHDIVGYVILDEDQKNCALIFNEQNKRHTNKNFMYIALSYLQLVKNIKICDLLHDNLAKIQSFLNYDSKNISLKKGLPLNIEGQYVSIIDKRRNYKYIVAEEVRDLLQQNKVNFVGSDEENLPYVTCDKYHEKIEPSYSGLTFVKKDDNLQFTPYNNRNRISLLVSEKDDLKGKDVVIDCNQIRTSFNEDKLVFELDIKEKNESKNYITVPNLVLHNQKDDLLSVHILEGNKYNFSDVDTKISELYFKFFSGNGKENKLSLEQIKEDVQNNLNTINSARKNIEFPRKKFNNIFDYINILKNERKDENPECADDITKTVSIFKTTLKDRQEELNIEKQEVQDPSDEYHFNFFS